MKSIVTDRCVVAAGDVVKKSLRSNGRVRRAMCVGIERTITDAGVVIAYGVDTKCVSTVGRVVAARICGIISPTKRLISGGGVVVTVGAHVECQGTDGRVAHAGRFVLERTTTDGRVVVFIMPRVLAKSGQLGKTNWDAVISSLR